MKIVTKEKQADYFNEISNQYHSGAIGNPPPHTEYEQASLIDAMHLGHDSHEKILDFGAGSGRITFAVIAKGHHVYAMDPSEQSLRNLSAFASKNNISPDSFTLTATIPEYILFDRIVGADILHHVDIDQELPILLKALSEKGKIVFSEPGAWNIAWYFFLLSHHSWDIERGILQMTIPTLSKSLVAAGFKHISIEGLGLLPMPLLNFSPRLHQLNRILARLPLLRYFSFRYVVTASKR
ncbi:MAG: class I SAM-dependent methyltransferase [Candidatus Roizmanbacteria bacterium]